MTLLLGHACRDLFALKFSSFVQLNHGSFGVCPKVITEEQLRFISLAEEHPDRWIRNILKGLIDESRRSVSTLINSDDNEEVVLIENASSAVNAILRSMTFLAPGDKILIYSSSYPMVKETLKFLSLTQAIEIVVVDLIYPIVDAYSSLIEPVERTLIEHRGTIKMCLFSHISSMPTMVEPVKLLTQLAQAHGALSFVDGAHAPGVIPIDVQDIGCDFYTGNLHKWCFTPKGCAFLWVAKTHHQKVQPTVISSTGLQDFGGKFNYTGTRDFTAFCCIPAALRFRRENFGDDVVCRNYLHDVVSKAAIELALAWGTELLVPIELCSSMVNVILPWSGAQDIVENMQKELDLTHGIYVVYGKVIRNPKVNPSEIIWFIRISGAVYLEHEDYMKIKELVPQLLTL